MSVLILPKCPVCQQELWALGIQLNSSIRETDTGTSYHMKAEFRCGAVATKGPGTDAYHWTKGCPKAMPAAKQV